MAKVENWTKKQYFKVYYDGDNYFMVYINEKKSNNYYAYGEEPTTHLQFEYHEGSVAMDERPFIRLKDANYEQIDCAIQASSINEFAEYLEKETKVEEIKAYFYELSENVRKQRLEYQAKINEEKTLKNIINNRIDTLMKKF